MAYNSNLTFVDLGTPEHDHREASNLEVGESKQANVSIKPARLADAKLTWASQDESVAKVDANGMVTGVADGETMDFRHGNVRVDGLCQGYGGQGHPGAPHLWRGSRAERPVPDGRRPVLEGHRP